MSVCFSCFPPIQLDKLLSCQEPITRKARKGGEAHDEHLFIVTHQSYEIWFKQVLYELSSVQKLIIKKLATKNTGNVSALILPELLFG